MYITISPNDFHNYTKSCIEQPHLTKKAPTGGAKRPPVGARPKAAPMLSLLNVVVLSLILYNYENNLEIWLYTRV